MFRRNDDLRVELYPSLISVKVSRHRVGQYICDVTDLVRVQRGVQACTLQAGEEIYSDVIDFGAVFFGRET